MEVKKVMSGTKEELFTKKYSIGIGISLGNKFFSIENILEYISFSLKFSKGDVIIYVADTIHAYNLHVRKRISFEKAKIIAVELGNEALTSVKNNLTQFSEDEISRIKFFSWSDIENTEEYQNVIKFTFDYFESNSDFRKELRGMIMLWTEKEERKFSNEDINIFAKYFLSELPECLDKVKIGGLDCDAYIYPFESTFTDFVYNIQLGNKYKDLRSGIMKYGPKTLIIYN